MPSRSAVVSTLLLFAGYAIGSYGLVLVRGWNISPLSWISPLNPYQWPADGSAPLCIPQGQLWGNGVGGIVCGGTKGETSGQATQNYLKHASVSQQGDAGLTPGTGLGNPASGGGAPY